MLKFLPDYVARDMGALPEPAFKKYSNAQKINSLVPYAYGIVKGPMHIWDVPYTYGSSHTHTVQKVRAEHNSPITSLGLMWRFDRLIDAKKLSHYGYV